MPSSIRSLTAVTLLFLAGGQVSAARAQAPAPPLKAHYVAREMVWGKDNAAIANEVALGAFLHDGGQNGMRLLVIYEPSSSVPAWAIYDNAPSMKPTRPPGWTIKKLPTMQPKDRPLQFQEFLNEKNQLESGEFVGVIRDMAVFRVNKQ